ncbi:MAG: hypothetical protein L0191_10110, partial [Acidobacteria bacterium]|nr:hypothetical protein [Acidobacteriota bacterium]
ASGFPVALVVSRLKGEERGTRFRIQILVPLGGLLTQPGSDPSQREIRLELGGQVVPLRNSTKKAATQEERDLWADVWATRKTWGFGRRATLQIPPNEGARPSRKGALYTREFLAPPGRYRVVVVVSDLYSHAAAASVADIESAPPAAPLGAVELGFEGKDVVSIPAEAPKDEAESEERWNGKELRPSAPSISPALLLASRPGVGPGRSLWALYEICEEKAQAAGHSGRSRARPVFEGWQIDRRIDCAGRSRELSGRAPSPPVNGAPCALVTEEVPAGDLPQGSCRLTVVLRRGDEVDEAQGLEFLVLSSSSSPTSASEP